MKHLGATILRTSFIALVVAAPQWSALADETLVIGTITIRTLDVYGDAEDAGFLGLAANRLHVKTDADVIRDLLLFHEGDPYEPERLEETERNLRKLAFLRTARITASEPHQGRVDVEVVTQDSWSTEPGLSFGSRGGGSRSSIELTERNLLGRGWDLQYSYESSPERTGQSLRFRDPSLFGPYWRAELLYGENSDGSRQSLHLERPFVSTGTPWSVLISGSRVEQEESVYLSGLAVGRYRASHDFAELGHGWALSREADQAHRLSVGLTFQRDLFDGSGSELPGELMPIDRDYRYVWAQYDYVFNDYVELDYVDRAEIPQDFNLGTELSLRLGLSPSALGVDRTTGRIDARISKGWVVAESSMLMADLELESRLGTVERNALASAGVQFLTRHENANPQVTILAVRYDQGWDLDRDHRLFADGENGLRGYRLHAFEGDQRMIVNAEQRLFLGRELFHLVSPGIAAFIDAGAVGDRSTGGWDSPKLNAGIGLLLGLSRSGRNTVRIDVTHAFSDDPLGRSPWLISVSGGRSF